MTASPGFEHFGRNRERDAMMKKVSDRWTVAQWSGTLPDIRDPKLKSPNLSFCHLNRQATPCSPRARRRRQRGCSTYWRGWRAGRRTTRPTTSPSCRGMSALPGGAGAADRRVAAAPGAGGSAALGDDNKNAAKSSGGPGSTPT